MDNAQVMQVGHARTPTFGFPTDERPEPKFPEDFITVAFVEVPDGNEANPDDAFQRTNHIDCAWWKNEGVTLVGEPEHRSTSVGDVVVMPDERILLCAHTGWKELKR